MTTTPAPVRPNPQTRLCLVAGLAVLVSACAGPRTVAKTDWLPDSSGWTVRDVDETDPPRWVLYERQAELVDVKELRIVGGLDAKPDAVARALRNRLFDDALLPEGVHRNIVRRSESEIEYYGFNAMPFPFDDREVNERYSFHFDPGTGSIRSTSRALTPASPTNRGSFVSPSSKTGL